MKYLVLIATLMFVTGQAYADQSRYVRKDTKDYRSGNVKVADPDHDTNNQKDAKDHGDQKTKTVVRDESRGAKVADRDSHRDSDRSHDSYRDNDRYRDSYRDNDRYRDSYRDSDRYRNHYYSRSDAFYRPSFGRIERRLPDRHVRIYVRSHPYYYFGGTYYDRYNGSYIIVNAPIGARITTLPIGYITFGIGATRYFYYGGTYYIYSNNAYEVVEPPAGAENVVNAAQQEMIIYPAKGQSQQQLDKDRYECHLWAVNQTGFDPSANNPDLSMKPDYNRAMGACLEARGYVVK